MYPQHSTLFFVESKSFENLRHEIVPQKKEAEFPINGAVGRVTDETERQVLDLHKSYLSRSQRRGRQIVLNAIPLCIYAVPAASGSVVVG
jgi:hypothetical protein